ncbi:MAG: hypothetical protein IKF19_01480 [Bacilli bacterium]|nr:hypothetical protein [Bacilli bacterium]
MTYQDYKKNYTEVTRQMQDYFETMPQFRIILDNIIGKSYEELTKYFENYEIFKLTTTICEIESKKNKLNQSMNVIEINKIIKNKINKIKENNSYYSKHNLYKLRSIKINKYNNN